MSGWKGSVSFRGRAPGEARGEPWWSWFPPKYQRASLPREETRLRPRVFHGTSVGASAPQVRKLAPWGRREGAARPDVHVAVTEPALLAAAWGLLALVLGSA